MTRHKRGDRRESDGFLFWQYAKGREVWLSTEQFEKTKQATYAAIKRYQAKNPEKVREATLRWKAKNPEKVREANRRWQAKNPEKVRKCVRDWRKAERARNPLFKLQCNLRSRTYRALSAGGFLKQEATEALLGAPWDTVRRYLEQRFEVGMTWDNYGDWHVDHVIPLSSAHDEYSLKLLCHYTNLKPLWATENLTKSDVWSPPEYCI